MKPQTKQLRTLLAVPGSLTGSGFKQLWSPNIPLLSMTWPHTTTIQSAHLNATYLFIDIFVRQSQFAISLLKQSQLKNRPWHTQTPAKYLKLYDNLYEHLIGQVESVYSHMKNMFLSRNLVQRSTEKNHPSTIST